MPRANEGEEEGEKEGDAEGDAQRGPKSIGLELRQLEQAPAATRVEDLLKTRKGSR